MASNGVFITLEGGEGAGKSTQMSRLKDALSKEGHSVYITREPGGSPGAEAIRELLVQGDIGRWDGVTESLLLAAARRDHVNKAIRPALERGQIVICDRFADSTLAYQGYGFGVDFAVLSQLYQIAVGDLMPDLTIMLDVPFKVGMARAIARKPSREDRYERMDKAFHERLQAGYRAIAHNNPERCRLVDAGQDADAVYEDIERIVLEHLSQSV